MQTFRDCERNLPVAFQVESETTCAAPQTFADYLCGIGPSTAPQMKSGASRAIVFGGAHLRFRLDAALVNDRGAPCTNSVKWIAAIVKLPLLEDEVTPAYLPNLAIARSQLSVVPATESDTDEDILWWRDGQLDLLNAACQADGDAHLCAQGLPADGGSDSCCSPAGETTVTQSIRCWLHSFTLAHAAALYGRMEFDTVIRAKRRIREREALFLVQHYVNLNPNMEADFNWPVRRNVYIRYAVR